MIKVLFSPLEKWCNFLRYRSKHIILGWMTHYFVQYKMIIDIARGGFDWSKRWVKSFKNQDCLLKPAYHPHQAAESG